MQQFSPFFQQVVFIVTLVGQNQRFKNLALKLHGFIATNDEPMLLTIEGKWLEANCAYDIILIFEFALSKTSSYPSFQFAFMVNFTC